MKQATGRPFAIVPVAGARRRTIPVESNAWRYERASHRGSHVANLIPVEEKIRFALHPSLVRHVVGIMGVHRQVCQQPHLPDLIVICPCLVDSPLV
jgi:hypothetical protein